MQTAAYHRRTKAERGAGVASALPGPEGRDAETRAPSSDGAFFIRAAARTVLGRQAFGLPAESKFRTGVGVYSCSATRTRTPYAGTSMLPTRAPEYCPP